jgi:hypothetical protein
LGEALGVALRAGEKRVVKEVKGEGCICVRNGKEGKKKDLILLTHCAQ